MRVPHFGQEGHAITKGRKVSLALTFNHLIEPKP